MTINWSLSQLSILCYLCLNMQTPNLLRGNDIQNLSNETKILRALLTCMFAEVWFPCHSATILLHLNVLDSQENAIFFLKRERSAETQAII